MDQLDRLIDRAKRLQRSGCILTLNDGRRIQADLADAISFLLSGELVGIEAADVKEDCGILPELIADLLP